MVAGWLDPMGTGQSQALSAATDLGDTRQVMNYANSILDRLSWRLRSILRHRPRPHRKASLVSEPVYVIGLFSTGSGIGQSARACADALEAGGYDVRRVDVSGLLNQVDMTPDGGGDLLDPTQNGLAIVHLNPPEFQTVLFRLGLRRWHNWRVIAYWVWELERVPASWRAAFDLASAIWSPSRFAADAISSARAGDIKVVPLHVAVPDACRKISPKGKPLSCLIMADGRSSLERKNLMGSVDVFYRAFRDRAPARLVIKVRNMAQYMEFSRDLDDRIAGDERVVLINETLSRAEIEALYLETDVLISCHRAEGFGLHLAEAMARGVAVMATAWSGNLDFMDEDCAIMLPASRVSVSDPACIYQMEEGAVWADPDTESAADKLREIDGDRALLARLGEAARASISHQLGIEPFCLAISDWAKPIARDTR